LLNHSVNETGTILTLLNLLVLPRFDYCQVFHFHSSSWKSEIIHLQKPEKEHFKIITVTQIS